MGEEVGVVDRVGVVDGDSVEVVEAVVVPLGESEAFVELVGERVGLLVDSGNMWVFLNGVQVSALAANFPRAFLPIPRSAPSSQSPFHVLRPSSVCCTSHTSSFASLGVDLAGW